jgi:hypothetical protein
LPQQAPDRLRTPAASSASSHVHCANPCRHRPLARRGRPPRPSRGGPAGERARMRIEPSTRSEAPNPCQSPTLAQLARALCVHV